MRGAPGPIGALLVSWLTSAAAAEVATLQPVRDNTLFEDATGSLSNGAGPVLYGGNNGQGLARRALLRFDVAGSVPAGARIDDVVLTLNVSNAPNSIVRSFTIHRVTEDWGEGTSSTTSGSGAPATPNDATWVNTFWPNSFWTSAGGSFLATPGASQEVGDVGLYSWTGAGLKDDVQSWLDQPAGNFGWLVLGDEVTLNTARRFDSRENAVAANRPTLAIWYSGPLGLDHPPRATGIRLEPPRPNPAASGVEVGFVLPEGGHARLEVRDAAGRHVATPAEGTFPAGRHEVRWDGRSRGGLPAAAGVYFCRLVVGGRVAGIRSLLLRH